MSRYQQIELRDGSGHIRRLQCWNEDSEFEPGTAWKYLSVHYDLHKTVREIRVTTLYWDDYVDIFKLYPPLSQDGITLCVKFMMRIDGLAKVNFGMDHASDLDRYRMESLTLESIAHVLAHVEPRAASNVEVCIVHTQLPGNWVLFGQCSMARASLRQLG
ncbi:hypothetical protein DFH09DRAFT_1301109 [Mycena vulgaris]|nr:hypothetical protein DFH09DRAFT_1301109 [Mycena vulgaris]